MRKPRPYHLEQCPTSTGQNQCTLDLGVDEYGEDRAIIIIADHDIFLKPRSARALAKRLLAMADWAENGRKTHARCNFATLSDLERGGQP